jgi:LCP family protein required for cell wall assembly
MGMMGMSENTPLLPEPAGEPAGPDHPRRRRILRALAVIGAVSLVGAVALGGVGAYYAHKYDSNVARINGVFALNPQVARPAKPAASAQNFLLVGSDARTSGTATGSAGASAGRLSNTIMIIHVAGDKKSASIVSIPPDSWVGIPGRGKDRITSAYALGGPPLLVQTVEQLTRIRIDHFIAVDFAGFATMTDAVGGVDIVVPADSHASANTKRWRPGPQHMDGATALRYVRQKYAYPGGDLDRIRDQQLFLVALMAKTAGNWPTPSPSTDGSTPSPGR